jgi:hypothetical protein
VNNQFEPLGRIGLNETWKWVLDGIELKSRDSVEFQIGEHWILGSIVEAKDGNLYWFSWGESVSVPIAYFIKARWSKKD